MNFDNIKNGHKDLKITIYQTPRVFILFFISLFPLSIPIIIDLLVLLEVLEVAVISFVEVIMVVFAKSEIKKNTRIYEMSVYRNKRKEHPRVK